MIDILGAGSLGCLWAAQLAPRHKIRFISTRPQTSKHISFTFTPINPEDQAQAHSFPSIHCDDISRIDTLLVCTKTYDSPPALEQLKRKLHANSTVILFQNGLGSHYAAREILDGIPVFAGVTTEGANKPNAHTIVHAGKGVTTFGAINHTAQNPPALANLTSVFKDISLKVEFADNIWPALWNKLCINCAINPYTALLDLPNGDIQHSDLFQQTWPQLREELSQALSLAGHIQTQEYIEQQVFHVLGHTSKNISSMLQDMRAGRRTEIDDINGFMSRYLEQNKQSNTINSMLWQQVTALSAEQEAR